MNKYLKDPTFWTAWTVVFFVTEPFRLLGKVIYILLFG